MCQSWLCSPRATFLVAELATLSRHPDSITKELSSGVRSCGFTSSIDLQECLPNGHNSEVTTFVLWARFLLRNGSAPRVNIFTTLLLLISPADSVLVVLLLTPSICRIVIVAFLPLWTRFEVVLGPNQWLHCDQVESLDPHFTLFSLQPSALQNYELASSVSWHLTCLPLNDCSNRLPPCCD